jgi:hypothetical protein
MKSLYIAAVLAIVTGCARREVRVAKASPAQIQGTVPSGCEGTNAHAFDEKGLKSARVFQSGVFEPAPPPASQTEATPVQLIVRSNGSVCAAAVLNWGGWQFDAGSAKDALSWQFEPAELNGHPVDVNMIVFIRRSRTAG